VVRKDRAAQSTWEFRAGRTKWTTSSLSPFLSVVVSHWAQENDFKI